MSNTTVSKQEHPNEVSTERTRGGTTFTPRVDIVELADELVLHADMPGVQLDGLDVRFENGELLLHGKCPPRNQHANLLLNEFGVGDFYRTFAISETIDPSRISAGLKNGVLTLHLPKSERTKAKRIDVKAN